jgi:hypothetical protein
MKQINFSISRLLTPVFLVFSCVPQFFAQVTEICYQSQVQEAWFKQHPELRQRFDAARQASNQRPVPATNYTIPVVFHILHTGGVENISDAQVQDQIAILTRDYNKLNADTTSVVPVFKPLIGNTGITFQLATRDPNGNCTNGIIRHWDANTHAWDGDFAKYLYSWPSANYLNVYVVRNITFNAAGYTYLPASGVPAAVDAIVMLSSYVGSIGTSNVGLSRVLTHECGHWLDLEHVWGWNQVGTTCGDDGVFDTPITKGFTSCNLGGQICNSGITENVQNYMDYSYCCKMFTAGQSARMQSAMTNPSFNRDFLSTPQNLSQTGITNPGINCLPYLDISALPSLTVCAGKPMTLKSFTWNANPSSYQWNANAGAVLNSPNSQSTSIIFNTPGTVTVTCLVSNSSGNAQKSLVVNVVNANKYYGSTYAENFDNTALVLPAFWNVINPTTPNEKWLVSPVDGINGTRCMCVPGEILTSGSLEMLESPSFDFKNNPGATFNFKYAYARASSTQSDVFKVQASKNCGGTWSDIWVPSMSSLSQGSGGTTPVLFHPSASQWKFYEITQHPNFIPFQNEENVKFRFYFREDSSGNAIGNRFYLDDVNYANATGVTQLAVDHALKISPNPSKGNFTISVSIQQAEEISFSLRDMSGRVLFEKSGLKLDAGQNKIELHSELELPSGIYLLQLQLSDGRAVQKIIID